MQRNISRSLLVACGALVAALSQASFTETYDDGTDVGNWILTTNTLRERTIQPTGGNPGAYLEGQVSASIPTWSTASTSYQPGFNDEFKRDSVFVGNWTAAEVTGLSADLDVLGVGVWGPDRAITLHLMQMDDTGFGVNYEATWTTADLPDVPEGWNHYDFAIDANGGTIPTDWVFTRGDGTPGTDAEWSTFLSKVDLVQIEYGKPGYFYPSLGVWTLGIDNIHLETSPTPEPASLAALGLGAIILIRRRHRK